jgi:hypothetical protein
MVEIRETYGTHSTTTRQLHFYLHLHSTTTITSIIYPPAILVVSALKEAPNEQIFCLTTKQESIRKMGRPFGHDMGPAGPTTWPVGLLLSWL